MNIHYRNIRKQIPNIGKLMLQNSVVILELHIGKGQAVGSSITVFIGIISCGRETKNKNNEISNSKDQESLLPMLFYKAFDRAVVFFICLLRFTFGEIYCIDVPSFTLSHGSVPHRRLPVHPPWGQTDSYSKTQHRWESPRRRARYRPGCRCNSHTERADLPLASEKHP